MVGARALFVVVLIAAGCGDNHTPEGSTRPTPASSSVGGSQVSHSKSFMLVTNVSPVDQRIASSRHHTLQPAMEGL